jgi:phage tail-like protein
MASAPLDVGTSVHFTLTIDNQAMGQFNTCSGLGVQVETETFREGGNNAYAYVLPTRLSFTNVQLTRALVPESAEITNWINTITTGIQPSTVEICALRSDKTLIIRWTLYNALPTRWTAPQFDPRQGDVAYETVEIAYSYFTASGE